MVCGENIVISLGQAGCQVGQACWELLCLEHGIYPDGTLATEYGHDRCNAVPETRPFFVESCPCKFVPRALFFDFDPEIVCQIKTGQYTNLYSHNFLVSGKEDACHNFARGYCSQGIEFIDCVMDKLRLMIEVTDHLDSFMILRSNCGGTGAGFGALLLSKLADEYGKTCKLSVELNPSARYCNAPIDAYNSVLSAHSSMDHIKATFLCENEKIYDNFERCLDLKCPNYHNVNQLIAQIFSGLTASFRFEGSLNGTPTELQTNLVPFSRIHFPLLTYAPLLPYEQVYHDMFSVNSLTKQAFEPTNQLLNCNPRKGKYLAAVLLYRGDVTLNDASAALYKFKSSKSNANRFQFVDWCPTAIKMGLNGSPGIAVPGSHMACGCRSIVGVINTTAIQSVFQRLLKKFDTMWYRRAYVHWFVTEGVEEEDIREARLNMAALMVDYHELGYSGLPGAINEEYREPSIDLHSTT